MKIIILSLFLPVLMFAQKQTSSIGPVYFPEIRYGEDLQGEETDSSDYSKTYPSYEERYILWILNRSRIAPQMLPNEDTQHPQFNNCINWGICFDSVKPLNYNVNLSRASRFHSNDMGKNGCFQHESCDGTDTFDRINEFYSGYSTAGENIGMGSAYTDCIHGLINEINNVSTEHPDGHRQNIFSADYNEVGLGYLDVNNKKYFTQDFGGKGGVKPETVTAGIHFPKRARENEEITFSAIYYDEDGNLPKKGNLILAIEENGIVKDVKSYSLTESDYKVDEKATFYAGEFTKNVAIESKGCHKYYFSFKNDDGSTYYYPNTGSLLVGIAQDCKNAKGEIITYSTERPEVESKGDDGCSFSGSTNSSLFAVISMLILFLISIKKRII